MTGREDLAPDGDDLALDYRVAFLAYVSRREEVALTRGYELGRTAIVEGHSLLELARVHHAVFLEVLESTPADELVDLVTAASEFFLEVLATADMAQRSLFDREQPSGRGAEARPEGRVPAPRPSAGGPVGRATGGASSARS